MDEITELVENQRDKTSNLEIEELSEFEEQSEFEELSEFDEQSEYEANSTDILSITREKIGGTLAIRSEDMMDTYIQQKMNTSLKDLIKYLKNPDKITTKNSKLTNIINSKYRKSYNLNEVDYFFDKLEQCRIDDLLINYGELQSERSGIMIDFDRYQTCGERMFKDDQFYKFAILFTKFINDYLELDKSEELSYNIFIIYRRNLEFNRTTDLYKDGVHILIPEIQISRSAKKFLFKKLIEKNIIKKCFGKIEEPNTDINDMMDMNATSVPVMFFGNAKPDKKSYKLELAYKVVMDFDDEMPMVSKIPIDKDGIPEKEYLKKEEKLKNTDFKINMCYELSLSFMLTKSLFFTPWLNKREYFLKEEFKPQIQDIVGNVSDSNNIYGETDDEETLNVLCLHDPDVRFLKDILTILDHSYCRDYDKWFKVMMALAGTSHTYKPLAKWFSEQGGDKYDECKFEEIWARGINTRGERKLTKKSLYYWAKECNPEKYKSIQAYNYFNILSKNIYEFDGKIGHSVVAALLKCLIGNKFVVDIGYNAGKKEYCWYEFVYPDQKHKKGEVFKWRHEFIPDTISRYISEKLVKIYGKSEENLKARRENAQEDQHARYFRGIEKNLRASKCSLTNHTYKNGVIKEATILFRVRGFTEELDTNAELLGVGNGVLVLGENPRLIQTFHEYKISKYTEVDYMPYDPNNKYISLLENAIKDIIPEDEVREFILMYMSKGLTGELIDALFLMLYGGGANGKTALLELIKNTLGEGTYAKKIPMSLLTSQREKPGSANSAFMELKGIRFAIYSESEGDEEENGLNLNTARFKEMTSPETQTGRQIYKEQESFKMCATQVSAQNNLFNVATTDHSVWRRILLYNMKVKFCEKPNPDNPYEKKENSDIAQVWPNDMRFKRAMLSILVHYNVKLRTKHNNNLKKIIPNVIKKETQIYRNSQDHVNRFITEMCVKSNSEYTYSIEDVADKFINWYRVTIGGRKWETSVAVNKLESSVLFKYFTRGNNNSLTLKNIRILERKNEDLEEGEELFFKV